MVLKPNVRVDRSLHILNYSAAANGIFYEMEKEKYTTSSEKIVLIIHNEGEEEFSSGTHFFLEKNVDGIWYEFPDDVEAVYADELAVSPGKAGSLEISISDLFHDFTPGEYRARLQNMAASFDVVE